MKKVALSSRKTRNSSAPLFSWLLILPLILAGCELPSSKSQASTPQPEGGEPSAPITSPETLQGDEEEDAEPSTPGCQKEADTDDTLLQPLDATKVGIANLGATCFLNSFFKHMVYNRSFAGLLNKELSQQKDESNELFAARKDLQQALRNIYRFLSVHADETETKMSGVYTAAFITAWNRIYQIEEEQGTFLVGLAEPLKGTRQGDSAEVLRYVHIALESPKLQILREYTALDPQTEQALPGLSKKQAVRAEDSVLRLTMGLRGADYVILLQGLIDEAYGPFASSRISDLGTWRFAGESDVNHLALQKMWVAAEDSDSVTVVLEDRNYTNYPDPTLHKNKAYLEIPQIIHLPIWQEDGQTSSKALRLRSAIVHEGGGTYGHYYAVTNERQADGSYRLVTHNDRRVAMGFNLENLARGARVLHYEVAEDVVAPSVAQPD